MNMIARFLWRKPCNEIFATKINKESFIKKNLGNQKRKIAHQNYLYDKELRK